jgi:hypothetical protein
MIQLVNKLHLKTGTLTCFSSENQLKCMLARSTLFCETSQVRPASSQKWFMVQYLKQNGINDHKEKVSCPNASC